MNGPNPNAPSPPPAPDCHSFCPFGSGINSITGANPGTIRYFITCVDIYGNVTKPQTCEENSASTISTEIFSFNCSDGQVATGVIAENTTGIGYFDKGQGAIKGIICQPFSPTTSPTSSPTLITLTPTVPTNKSADSKLVCPTSPFTPWVGFFGFVGESPYFFFPNLVKLTKIRL